MKSAFASIMGLSAGLFGFDVPSLPAPLATYRNATPGVRSRRPGPPGKPGDKLRRMANERRLSVSTIR